MKAVKFTVSVTMEMLSIDVVHSLLMQVSREMREQNVSGELIADDGDTVRWTTTKKDVDF